MKKRRNRIMCIVLSIVFVVSVILVTTVLFINQPSFGRLPRGERLERIQHSPNYRDGSFQNLSPTQQITSEGSKIGTMIDFLIHKVEALRPATDLPTVKTDLKRFSRDEDVLVWLGHSTLFFQTDSVRFLTDPTLVAASPVSFFNKPFKGTNLYSPDDIPNIDYLIISHDHWDHLDYQTIKRIKDRIGKVICPLGVGEHFEYWGIGKDRIVELDWNEQVVLDNGSTIYCLPTRHFSGRGLSPNKTLWASYMLQTPSQSIYLGGDGGYDTHFANISKRFGEIDLAILENGQYDKDWKYIHLLPQDLVQAAKDLHAKRLMTVHNSKYALGKHAWYAPLENISKAAEQDSLHLITPMIGEPVHFDDTTQVFSKWWSVVK